MPVFKEKKKRFIGLVLKKKKKVLWMLVKTNQKKPKDDPEVYTN